MADRRGQRRAAGSRNGPAICALAKAGKMTAKDISRAIKQYKIGTDKPDPALA